MSESPDRLAKVSRFLELHKPGAPLLLPNPWDPGTARILAALAGAAREFKEQGTQGFWTQALASAKIANEAFE